jgi:hyperosmotically inducible periplasmic protein
MKTARSRLALIVAIAASLFLINGSLFASDMDDRIESSAKESYVFKTYLSDDDIKIESKDGIVTLNGDVSEEAHKQLAAETLANLPGVKSVNNKLELKGEAPAEYSDAWLMTKVKTSLLFHRSVSGIKTEVLAEDGIVTLRGEATSLAQKDLATKYAQDVEGVKDVQNEMTVVTVAIKADEKTMGEKTGEVKEWIDDASITALVKTALLYHRSTSGLNTTVVTKEGLITMSGKAKNGAEKDLATELASDVHGVKSVVNKMTVEQIDGKTKFKKEPFNERIHNPMSENFKYKEDLQSMLQKWNAEYEKLEEIQVAGEGGLKDLKQSLDKKWTAFEQIFEQARNRFR